LIKKYLQLVSGYSGESYGETHCLSVSLSDTDKCFNQKLFG